MRGWREAAPSVAKKRNQYVSCEGHVLCVPWTLAHVIDATLQCEDVVLTSHFHPASGKLTHTTVSELGA